MNRNLSVNAQPPPLLLLCGNSVDIISKDTITRKTQIMMMIRWGN